MSKINDIEQLKRDKYTLVEEYRALKDALTHINERLKEETIDTPTISEHAKIRYLERYTRFNTDRLCEEILTEEALIMYRKRHAADGEYETKQGHTLVIKNQTVVTIK